MTSIVEGHAQFWRETTAEQRTGGDPDADGEDFEKSDARRKPMGP